MTTEAPLQQAVSTPAHDLKTAPIKAPDAEPILDAFGMLDHRARSQAVTRRLARRGHYLAVQDGEEVRLIPLPTKITHVGRGNSSDLRFEDQRVSRTHAIIVRHGRYARVLDNRSANGTYVNGQRIVATNIANGDVIRLGPIAVQYIEVP
jgi:pSer/pThr/pTyr-binding forkhead associated (FHA) protein